MVRRRTRKQVKRFSQRELQARADLIRRARIKQQISAKERQSNFVGFGKVPRDNQAIFDKVAADELRQSNKVDFLGGETMMFGDDLLGTEAFVPRRISDL